MTQLHIEDKILPLLITTEPPLTADEFESLALAAEDVRLEQTAEGKIVMMSPTGGYTGQANSEINGQLYLWYLKHKSGRIFDSSTAFRLPDNSTLSPDASYASEERLAGVELTRFPQLCPNFVVEIRSASDSLERLKLKMEKWIENGAELAYLIDPKDRQVWVYRKTMAGIPAPVILKTAYLQANEHDPVPFFNLDLNRVWHCYPPERR